MIQCVNVPSARYIKVYSLELIKRKPKDGKKMIRWHGFLRF